MGKKAAVVFLTLVTWLTGCSMPETTEPEVTNPETVNSGTVGPETVNSGTAGPETVNSGTAGSETVNSGTAGPETVNSGTADPETVNSGTADSETVNSGTTGPETANFGTAGPDTANLGTADPEKGEAEEWETVSCRVIDSNHTFKQIYMYDKQSGWALTSENELLFTDEGAEKFSVMKKVEGISAVTDGFLSASFLGEHTVYLTYFPEDHGQLAVEYTDDGGASWQKTLLDYTDFGAACDAGSAYLALTDEKTGYLLYCSTPGAGNMTKILLETADGGRTFAVKADLSDRIAGYPQGITFHGNKGYIAVSYHGADSYLYTTADGGLTWEDEKIASAESMRAGGAISYIDGYPPVFSSRDGDRGVMVLKMVNKSTMYQIFETADGGGSWSAAGTLPCDSLNGCAPDGADGILFLDGAGKLYAVSD